MPLLFRTSGAALPVPWDAIFGPLRAGTVDDLTVFGQLGQSLDGRVATPTGHSHYINGADGLDHLHRLRSLADAVVVGVGTAIADDPQLTVRRVPGPSPVRVVLDPRGRLPPSARLLAGGRAVLLTAPGTRGAWPETCEVVKLPLFEGSFRPAEVLQVLALRGIRRILVEGGARTVSAFIHARCLDRLHILVGPLLLGSGSCGVNLPAIDKLDQALRPRVHAHLLGAEVLFDCDLSDYRSPVGVAKKST